MELLQRFSIQGEELAFETLMHRDGPMVLAVCRGVLNDPHDVQDAFQATFLVLVRKARSLWAVERSLGSWLYRVAYRIAIQSNADRNRRYLVEKRAGELVDLQSGDEIDGDERILPALREAIGKLPHLRDVFVIRP